MKRSIILSISLYFIAFAAFAQRTATSFDVDGIKVIFKPTVKNVISVRVFYRGGVANYPADKAGIEDIALEAAGQCGTQKYSADVFRDRTDKFGVVISGESDYDYGDITLDCVSKYFNESWDLLTGAVTQPVFEEGEVEQLKAKAIARIRQSQSDPDDHIRQLAVANAFAGTPYATDPKGTEEAVSKLTAAELKSYYSSILNKNQMFIVVAGNISKEELISKVRASFGSLPSRQYTPVTYTPPVWNDYKVLAEKRDLQTNYINGVMNAPPVNSDDFFAYRLGISVLSGELFGELRTRLHLSYDPGAETVNQLMPFAIMSVSTSSPKEAVKAMTEALNLERNSRVTPEGLTELKSSYITGYFMKEQSSSAITESLGQAEVLGGWETAENLPDLVNKVTAEQISGAINKYIAGLRWAYLGNADQANEAEGAFNKKVR
ncbi:pitrilysin family protein [Mucilaginibacter sp.]|jgi:predicted Zn-dependent peptidase|uniref:M16 family metallopeptidase n=1 Tax=Mucilaginibacter sp. TaxID=1882438 RepID=UPI002B5A7DDE|nr:pitrilysin family protein [Mucilaginibacter sp.]HTI58196.1 pitrilysin family protein [Mucilaginibacter sp.]